MVEPSFYQRVFAARSPSVARSGVIVSVGLWALFDFFSIGCGLAARVLLPGLEDPLAAYPALAEMVLSPWMAAVFTLALFATVMSTLDSYLFLSATTIGHDVAIVNRPHPRTNGDAPATDSRLRPSSPPSARWSSTRRSRSGTTSARW